MEKLVWYEKSVWIPQLGSLKLKRAKIVEPSQETLGMWTIFKKMNNFKDIHRDHFDQLLVEANKDNNYDMMKSRVECNCDICNQLKSMEEELVQYEIKDRTNQ